MSNHPPGFYISRALLLVAAACFLAGTGITLADIAVRVMFNSHVYASIELTTLFIALGALLSMPVTYARRRHITAKLLSEFLPSPCGKGLNILGASFSVLFSGVLLAACALTLIEKIGSPETTPDTGAPVYMLLTVVVITLSLAFMATLYGLIRSIMRDDSPKEACNG